MSTVPRENGGEPGDELCFDFVDPGAPACALVRVTREGDDADAQAVLLTPDATLLAGPTRSQISVDDDGTRASISVETGAGALDAEFTRLTRATVDAGTAFADATGITREAFAARAEARWRAGGEPGEAACVGRVVRTAGAPDWDRVERLRSLTVTLDDCSVLVVASARPAGSAGHDAEAVSAVLAEADGSVVGFDDPLVSTEYDRGGEQRRVGVELWPSDPDAVVVRGAGTLVASSEAVAFLRFGLDGRAGTGRYEILPAA